MDTFYRHMVSQAMEIAEQAMYSAGATQLEAQRTRRASREIREEVRRVRACCALTVRARLACTIPEGVA